MPRVVTGLYLWVRTYLSLSPLLPRRHRARVSHPHSFNHPQLTRPSPHPGAGGGLGHIGTQLGSRGMGYRIIGIDSDSKRDLVLSSGAEHFLPLSLGAAIPAKVRELTDDGLGAHAVVVLTAANAAYAQAIDLLRFGGTLVAVGMPEGEGVPIAGAVPQWLISKALRVVGVTVGDRREAIETLDFARRGLVKSQVRVEKMERLGDVFREMEEGKLHGRVVLDLS